MANAESTVVKYEDALGRVSPLFAPLVEKYTEIQKLGQRIYLTQQRQGFLPEDLTPKDMNELKTNSMLRSPYQLKRRDESGQLYGVDYKDVSPFRSQFPDMAGLISDAARFAVLQKLPEYYLIETTLNPQAQALRDGNFERAMLARLNTVRGPEYESFFGLLDRYKDTVLNLHYAFQGWAFRRDGQMTNMVDQISQHGLERTSTYLSRPKTSVPRRIVAGEVLVFSGLAAESQWGGDTLPSEDKLRHEMGSLSYLNINVLDKRFEVYVRNYIMKYVPEIAQSKGWEEKAKRAMLINYALHEVVGHGLVMFDESSEGLLGNRYTALKELEAELLSFVASLRLPPELADISMKKTIIGTSLAGWIKDIKESKGTYHDTAVFLLNFLESHNAIDVNEDNWEIKLGDIQQILEASRDALVILDDNIETEARFPGGINRFVDLYSTYPKSYICDESKTPSVQHSSV